MRIKQGATVQFKGGLGRGDDPATIHTGIVNGPTEFAGGSAYVPVHVREVNHNLVVLSTNIVKVVSA
jgi:hypothetical protein